MRSTTHDAGMHCPLDKTMLVMSERQGIEIDYCPTCRGVWLDRGELDKIVERSGAESEPDFQPTPSYNAREASSSLRKYDSSGREFGGDDRYRPDRNHKGRKKSFLSELFD